MTTRRTEMDIQIITQAASRMIAAGATTALFETLQDLIDKSPAPAVTATALMDASSAGINAFKAGLPYRGIKHISPALREAWGNGWTRTAEALADQMTSTKSLIENHEQFAHAADCAACILEQHFTKTGMSLGSRAHHELTSQTLRELQCTLENLGKPNFKSEQNTQFTKEGLASLCGAATEKGAKTTRAI